VIDFMKGWNMTAKRQKKKNSDYFLGFGFSLFQEDLILP